MILVALGNLFLYLRKDTGLIKCMRLSHQTENTHTATGKLLESDRIRV